MAPPPPTFDVNATYEPGVPSRLMAFNGQAIPFPSHISLTDHAGMPLSQDALGSKAALKTEPQAKKCRIQDRFDRDQLIAYQWNGVNRLGLDVDGISLGSSELEGVKVQYTLKLQNHKTRKEKCRYDSHWQGMLGSAYNEFYLRKENTVWQQLDDITDDAEEAWDKLTD